MTYKKIDYDSKIVGMVEAQQDSIPSAFLRGLNDNLNKNIVRDRNCFGAHTYFVGTTDYLDLTEDDIAPDSVEGSWNYIYDSGGIVTLQTTGANRDTIGMQFSTPVREPTTILIPWAISPDAESIKIRIALKNTQMTGSIWCNLMGAEQDRTVYPPMMQFREDPSNTEDLNSVNVLNIPLVTGNQFVPYEEITYTDSSLVSEDGSDLITKYNAFHTVVDSLSNGVKVGVTDQDGYNGVDGVNYYVMTIPLSKTGIGNVKFLDQSAARSGFNASYDRLYTARQGFIAVNFFGGVDWNNPKTLAGSEQLDYLLDFNGVNPNPFAVVDRGTNNYESVNPNNFGKFHYAIKITTYGPNREWERERLHSVQSIHGVDGATGVSPTYGTPASKSSIDPVYVVYPAVFLDDNPLEIADAYALYPVSKFEVYSISIEEVKES